MGLITRPTKTSGTTQYTTEFAAGSTKIKKSEVDADLNTVYGAVNGSLDTANLSASAGILATQLAGSIPGTKIASATLDTTNLKAAAGILGSQLDAAAGIVATQLVAGFPVLAATLAQPVANPLSIAAGVEGDLLASVVTLTPRGAVIIVAQIGAYAGPPTASQGNVIYRLYKDTPLAVFTPGNRIAEITKQVGPITVNGLVQDASMTFVAMDGVPGAGSHTYKVTAEPSSSLTQVAYATQTHPGSVWVLEFN